MDNFRESCEDDRIFRIGRLEGDRKEGLGQGI